MDSHHCSGGSLCRRGSHQAYTPSPDPPAIERQVDTELAWEAAWEAEGVKVPEKEDGDVAQ